MADSPNRTVTAGLNWSHPEHTIELTPAEAAELTTLAGFEVESVTGLWQCLDNGRLLSYQPGTESDLVVRTVQGLDAPDASFIWWLEESPRR